MLDKNLEMFLKHVKNQFQMYPFFFLSQNLTITKTAKKSNTGETLVHVRQINIYISNKSFFKWITNLKNGKLSFEIYVYNSRKLVCKEQFTPDYFVKNHAAESFFYFLPRNTYWNRRLCLFYLIHQQGKTVWVFCSAQMCEHPCNIWVQSGYLKPSEFAFDHSHCIDTRTIGTMIKVTDNSTENVHGIIFNFYSNKKDLSVSRWWGKCKLIHGLLQKMKHWWK